MSRARHESPYLLRSSRREGRKQRRLLLGRICAKPTRAKAYGQTYVKPLKPIWLTLLLRILRVLSITDRKYCSSRLQVRPSAHLLPASLPKTSMMEIISQLIELPQDIPAKRLLWAGDGDNSSATHNHYYRQICVRGTLDLCPACMAKRAHLSYQSKM